MSVVDSLGRSQSKIRASRTDERGGYDWLLQTHSPVLFESSSSSLHGGAICEAVSTCCKMTSRLYTTFSDHGEDRSH